MFLVADMYIQCIVVATRPFLYLFLEKRCKSSEDRVAVLFSKEPIRHILKIGIESAKRISAILHALKRQHLIGEPKNSALFVTRFDRNNKQNHFWPLSWRRLSLLVRLSPFPRRVFPLCSNMMARRYLLFSKAFKSWLQKEISLPNLGSWI